MSHKVAHASDKVVDIANNNKNETIEFQRTCLQLVWKDVSYDVPVHSTLFGHIPLPKVIGKQCILQPMSGRATAGSMTAVMGPSGAGKTTLLNIISGRIRERVRGDVRLLLPREQESNIRIGFVPQNEHLFLQFTVYETILFASKLNNDISDCDHKKRVNDTLSSLDLNMKKDEKLAILSGGQLKRVSIALELISSPKILILDEPTTGLDSNNAESVVRLLKNLTLKSDPPSIIATVHQPSADTFNLFDSVYFINRYGQHIYSGPPNDVVDYVTEFGFERKTYTSSAEYITEIANGKYGKDKFAEMKNRMSESPGPTKHEDEFESVPVHELACKEATTSFNQFQILVGRCLSAYITRSSSTIISLMAILILYSLLIFGTVEKLGVDNGCWPVMTNFTALIEKGSNITFFDTIYDKTWDIEFEGMIRRSTRATLFFFSALVTHMFLGAMTAVFIHSREVLIVKREMANNWYNCGSYAAAKMFADGINTLVILIPSTCYWYFAGGFSIEEYWRLVYGFIPICLVVVLWQSRGFFACVIFNGNTQIALNVMAIAGYMNLVLSGYIARVEYILWLMRPLTYICDLSFAFEALFASIYGFGKCNHKSVVTFNNLLTKDSLKSAFSKIWSTLGITDEDARKFSLLLGVKDTFFGPVFKNIAEEVGPYEPQAEDLQPSFFLYELRVNEDKYSEDILYIMMWILFSYITVYFGLRLVMRKNSRV